MNDESANSLPPSGDPALEARIVAWVLEEASPFEAAELEKLCAADPALRSFERQMRDLHGLIGADAKGAAGPAWALPPDKRRKITDLLGVENMATVANARTNSYFSRRILLAAAACMMISVAVYSVSNPPSFLIKQRRMVGQPIPQKSVDFMPSAGGGGGFGSSSADRQVPMKKDSGRVAEYRESDRQQESLGTNRRKRHSQVNNTAEAGKSFSSLQAEKVELESQLKTLAASDKETLMRYADGLNLPDNVVPQLLPQVRTATRELEAMKATGMDENNPKLLAQKAAVEGMEKDLSEATDDLRSTIEQKLELTKEKMVKSGDGQAAGGEMAMNTPHEPAAAAAKPSAAPPLGRAESKSRLAEADPAPESLADLGAVGAAGGLGAAHDWESRSKDLAAGQAGISLSGGRVAAAGAMTGDGMADILSSGSRSGNGEISRNNIDAILENPNSPTGAATLPWVGGLLPDAAVAPEPALAAQSRYQWGLQDEGTKLGLAAGSPADAQVGATYHRSLDSFGAGVAVNPNPSDLREMGEPAGRSLNEAVDGYALSSGGAAAKLGTEFDLLELAKREQQFAAAADTPSVLPPPPAAQPQAPAESKQELADMDDSIRNNPALAAEHTANVDQVRRNLYLAEGAHNLGKYDDAKRAYEDVIKIDPSNKAARRGLERTMQAKADYYRAEYDQTRAELLAQVDGAWEMSVPPLVEENSTQTGKPAQKEVLREGKVNIEGNTKTREKVIRRELPLEPGSVDQESARAQAMREEGEKSWKEGDLAAAYQKHNEALGSLPDVPGTKESRKLVIKSLGDLASGIAADAKARGQEEESRVWAGKTLQWDPSNKNAKAILAVDPGNETSSAAEPFSTFSLHVSDASFKLAKAALERGEMPAAESIRPEEFYNAFDYGDAAPASGEPVVCAVEQSAHPVLPQRNLVRIGVKTGAQGRGQSTPLNLVLLLDSSGSMEREDRQAGMAKAVEQLSGLLKEGDTISVAGFSRQPRLLADRLPGARAQELNAIIAQTPSEGGTNLEEGLKLAEELAKRQFNPAAQNRVVLFTDGAANLGDAKPETLQAKVEQLRQQGIAFDAAGFGADGLNDRLLERLTRNGNGRYYVVDRPEDAGGNFARQLAGAFRPAAENVKVQVRFNAARVGHYKLLGFEEHRLAKEDFRNDAVDAAEMAAEEAGNALYQVETLPQGEGEIGEVSVRFRDAASGQMVERTWTIPYEAQAPAFDHASPSIQLAGLAALAAERLRGGPMAAAIDFKALGKTFAAVKAKYLQSQPVADLGMMIEKLK